MRKQDYKSYRIIIIIIIIEKKNYKKFTVMYPSLLYRLGMVSVGIQYTIFTV